MQRLDATRLTEMALAALEEVAARCHIEPVEKSRALALVLAYLASSGRGDRWPFDRFWQSIGEKRGRDRWSNVNAALNGIYIAIGEKRDTSATSRFEAKARAAVPAKNDR